MTPAMMVFPGGAGAVSGPRRQRLRTASRWRAGAARTPVWLL